MFKRNKKQLKITNASIHDDGNNMVNTGKVWNKDHTGNYMDYNNNRSSVLRITCGLSCLQYVGVCVPV